MHEVSDIKQILDAKNTETWRVRVRTNPIRLYAIILSGDEHGIFNDFLVQEWNSLDKLSGLACDILIFEQNLDSQEKIRLESYIEIKNNNGMSRIVKDGQYYGHPRKRVFLDNGITVPSRRQGDDLRLKMFKDPRKVNLPGIVIFGPRSSDKGVFQCCMEIEGDELSNLFQETFLDIKHAHESGADSENILKHFLRLRRERAVNGLLQVVMNNTPENILSVLGSDLQAALPKA